MTVAMLGAILVLVVLASGALAVGAAVQARHVAQVAADHAALAGAQSLASGSERPCTVVAQVAQLNGGVVRSCQARGGDLLVTVTVQVSQARLGGWLTQGTLAHGRARAGPGPP